ncbi:hypothetical protein JTB14_026462 [Gonioctena quinquepunctata]|nr:hypothetical protein JTB14_026462 [Gonioctena quinquepunctata]
MELSEVDDDAFIYTDSTINIKGITNEYVSSIGISYGEIQLSNDMSIMHKFHIVPNMFPISAQGILGKDFISKFQAKINYETPLLTIPVHNSTFTFKMTSPHEIVVPPRSEFTTKIRTHFSQPKICLNEEVTGLLSNNCIVDPKNGLASYYRRSIPNFTKIAYPLNNIPKKNVSFRWTSLYEKSFGNLEENLISPPIIQYPDFEKEFILTTKASQYGIGYDDHYNELKSRTQHSHEIAGETIIKHKDIVKTYHDKISNPSRISEGDKVLLKNEHTTPGESR